MRILAAIILSLGISFIGKADPGDAWPWGAEMPFPWKGIQGTWLVYLDGQPTLYAFRTVQSKNGTNQLDVTQYDAHTCQVLAQGAGFEEERVVRGLILTNKTTQNITIHVFSEAALKYNKYDEGKARAKAVKTYTVMNITNFGAEESETFELKKVHNSPTGICAVKKR